MRGKSYIVCPRCGNPMVLLNGVLVCKVCGYRFDPKAVEA